MSISRLHWGSRWSLVQMIEKSLVQISLELSSGKILLYGTSLKKLVKNKWEEPDSQDLLLGQILYGQMSLWLLSLGLDFVCRVSLPYLYCSAWTSSVQVLAQSRTPYLLWYPPYKLARWTLQLILSFLPLNLLRLLVLLTGGKQSQILVYLNWTTFLTWTGVLQELS